MRVLILAKSGFGKSSSLGEIPELGIKGLNPSETYLISCVPKPLPFRGYAAKYKETTLAKVAEGNRIITNDGPTVAQAIKLLTKSPFKNIVIDDINYISQDFYMKNALKGGWDTAKIIGYNMGLIFEAMNKIPDDKNIIIFAHYEEYKDKNGDSISYRYKSTGNMVDTYILPEGKFEIVLFGKSRFDDSQKKSIREFVTNDDGQFPAKSPYGMFPDLYIPNDLNIVITLGEQYNKG